MRRFFLLPLALLALAACGGGDETEPQPTPQPGGTAAIGMGPGISVSEAMASDLEGPLLVNGSVLAEGGEIRFCEALAESFPPQCGGASLVVEGLKLEEVDGLVREGDVAWTDRPTQLLGTVEGDRLVVSSTAVG